MTSDPRQLKSGRCRCGKPIPEYALKEGDPFCSTPCCHEFYGITIAMSEGMAEGGRRKGYIDKKARAA